MNSWLERHIGYLVAPLCLYCFIIMAKAPIGSPIPGVDMKGLVHAKMMVEYGFLAFSLIFPAFQFILNKPNKKPIP